MLRDAPGEPRRKVGFYSKYEKNSDEYLRELCCMAWPRSLHARIGKMDKTELTVNSFTALIVNNFLGWYGTKIPTSDDEFLTLLFDLIQDVLTHLRNVPIDYECLLADDLPLIVSQHVQAMRRLLEEQHPFEQYCKLILYENAYPELITRQLKKPLENGSRLQSTFLDALFNDLLFGKIMDRALEPYYVLHAITKLEPAARPEQGQRWSLQRVKDEVTTLGRFIIRLISMEKWQGAQQQLPLRPFLHRYAFTFLFEDLCKFHDRKPALFAIAKILQYWATKSRYIDKIMHSLFYNSITARIIDPSNWQNFFLSMRQALFPTDSEMGPGAIIPAGEEFEALKLEARNKLWQVARIHHLDLLLGTTLDDVYEFIEMLSKDKQCNKLLCFRIIDCLLAQQA